MYKECTEMPRKPRFVIPGQPQHVIQRGNNRQAVFATEDDYRFFLKCLGDAATRQQCDIQGLRHNGPIGSGEDALRVEIAEQRSRLASQPIGCS